MIINSLLDNDFYKFTMANAVFHNYPDAVVEYKFKDRSGTINGAAILPQLRKEIDHLCTLEFTKDEINYLSKLKLFGPNFIMSLHPKRITSDSNVYELSTDGFRLKRDQIHCGIDKDRALTIDIIGPWKETIFFEVPVLSIISELHSKYQIEKKLIPETDLFWLADNVMEEIEELLYKNSSSLYNNCDAYRWVNSNYNGPVRRFNGFKFADFGTRRRLSFEIHERTIKRFLKFSTEIYPDHHVGCFVGTSNVFFANEFNVKPIGTMAHEWLQAHQALCENLEDFQEEALKVWTKTYQGDVGIALSDIVGFDAFLKDFSFWVAMTYTGARHDSGDPIVWGNKLIDHYRKIGVNPQKKHAIFSDGLTFKSALEIFNVFKDKINVSFGIGTKFTNNVPGIVAPNIVLKMVKCNGLPVAKISDSPGKGMCEDEGYLKLLKSTFNID